MIRFTIPGEPKGKQRARTVVQGGRVHSYTPSQTVQYERKVAMSYLAAAKGFQFAENAPLRLSAYIYMPIPKSANKGLRERLNGVWHTKRPDIDNVLKAIEYGLNGVAYADDSQIAAEYIQKKYSDCPRVEVRIEVIE